MKIMDGGQNKRVKRIEQAITAIGWSYVILTLLQVLLSLLAWYFNLSHLANQLMFMGDMGDTVAIVLTTIVIAAISMAIMHSWGSYNQRRFGPLKRRDFPEPVSRVELAQYFQMSQEQVAQLQSQSVVELTEEIFT